MELTDLTASAEDFSFYYSEWRLSRRQWKLKGIKYTSLANDRIDTDWAAEIIIADALAHREAVEARDSFRASLSKYPRRKTLAELERLEQAEKNHMPSHETSVLLLFAQVQTLHAFISGLRTIHHYEMIYEVLTDRALRFHHSILDEDGKPKRAFLKNPISHLENCCKKVVNQLMYDIYRTSIEERRGLPSGGLRALERRGREVLNTVTMPSNELITCMDMARCHSVTLMDVLTADGPHGFSDDCGEW